jgi:hypothetical protein
MLHSASFAKRAMARSVSLFTESAADPNALLPCRFKNSTPFHFSFSARQLFRFSVGVFAASAQRFDQSVRIETKAPDGIWP